MNLLQMIDLVLESSLCGRVQKTPDSDHGLCNLVGIGIVQGRTPYEFLGKARADCGSCEQKKFV